MNTRIKICLLILFSIVTTPLFYYISDNPGLIQNKLINSRIINKIGKKSTVIFDLNTSLENHMISHMKTYEIKAKSISKEELKNYAKKLDIKTDDIKEDSSSYILQNDINQLVINKDTGLIQYKNLKYKDNNINKKITSEEAIEIVIDFIEKLELPCNHKKCLVEDLPKENIYQLRFVNSLEGILNYGYYTKAEITYNGELLNFDSYQLVYKPLKIVPIKTKKQAYDDLIDIPFEEKNLYIDIQKIELVYYSTDLEKSAGKKLVLEPAYRFFGEISRDASFEYFIPAIKD
ncbi:MAG: hypothetical protein GX327_09195 [Epulopiscium sp.]|nr:hypothetical protein [Candidatus Epulonipiscium sp.]